jgi:hypothetical protein
MDSCKDMSERFDFVEEALVYVDAPLEGLVRHKATGELFAFRCHPVIQHCVWCWVLLPVEGTAAVVASAFEHARAEPSQRWLSAIEDKRSADSQVVFAWLVSDKHPIP